MATHSQCQPRPHPFSPTATPPLLLVEESPGGQRVSVPQPPRHGAVCPPPPPPPLLPFQFAPRLQQTQPRIRVTSAYVSQKSDPSGKPYFSPSQGTSSILVPSPNVYLCPVCEFHGLKAKKTRGKQTEGWGVGALRSLVFVIWII